MTNSLHIKTCAQYNARSRSNRHFSLLLQCLNSPNILDFTWDPDTSSYLINNGQAFSTNDALLTKIQTGKGSDLRYAADEFIKLDNLVSETSPADFYQKTNEDDDLGAALVSAPIGTNNLAKAKAVTYTYIMKHSRNPDIEEEAYLGFEENL